MAGCRRGNSEVNILRAGSNLLIPLRVNGRAIGAQSLFEEILAAERSGFRRPFRDVLFDTSRKGNYVLIPGSTRNSR
jgi:hypothetical protein